MAGQRIEFPRLASTTETSARPGLEYTTRPRGWIPRPTTRPSACPSRRPRPLILRRVIATFPLPFPDQIRCGDRLFPPDGDKWREMWAGGPAGCDRATVLAGTWVAFPRWLRD